MTISEPKALTMLAAWLRPVLAIVDEVSIETSKSWVVALANSQDVNVEELTLAAFGQASKGLSVGLEAKLADATATYAPEGKTELIAHLAGASLMHSLEACDAKAVDIMCRCESLLFLGWTPVIADLPDRVRKFADDQARKLRSRVTLEPMVRPPRKRVKGDLGAEDQIEKLSTDLVDLQTHLGRAIDRIETVVGQFNARLELLDEEVDTLWWARSDRSTPTGADWSDLTTLQRAVLAAIEITSIVGPHPPTAGTLTVMNDVIGTSDEAFALIEIVAALREQGWTGSTRATEQSAAFCPLSFGIASMMKFDNDKTIVEKILSTTLLGPAGHKVSASAVAQQILNEHALRNDDD